MDRANKFELLCERQALVHALELVAAVSDSDESFEKARVIAHTLADTIEEKFGDENAEITIAALYLVMTSMAQATHVWRVTKP